MQEFSDDMEIRKRNKIADRLLKGWLVLMVVGLVVAVTVEGIYVDQRFDRLKSDMRWEIEKQEKTSAGLSFWAEQTRIHLGELNASWVREWKMSRTDWEAQDERIGKLETRIKKNLEENVSDEQDWTALR
jgi:hypothetical protein